MPLDPSLLGHESPPLTVTITAEDIRSFADAVGDTNPIFRDPAAAQLAGFPNMPALPTFVTRFRISFADAGLDPERTQILHGEQEYVYARPLYASDTLVVRHRVAALRQTARAGGMAIMTLEQLGDTPQGEHVVTGRSTVIVRDTPPDASAAAAGESGARMRPLEPGGEAIPTLTKQVSQEQINAYADVSGDHNPIHVNPAAARAVGLDGTIAHGMLSMAFVGQVLTDWATARTDDPGWVARLKVRFQAMVRPGDTLTCHGVPGQRDGDRQRLDVWIDNQHGERILSGDADVVLKGR